MRFFSKLLVAIFTISATIVGSIWTGFETLDGRMDSKVQQGKTEVISIIHNLREERNALMKAQDDKVSVQLAAITSEVGEMRKDIRVILRISRDKVVLDKQQKSFYTNIAPLEKEEKSL